MTYIGKNRNPSKPSLLVNRREAGEMLSVSSATIARYERFGTLQRVKLKNTPDTGNAKYRRSDVEALVAACTDVDRALIAATEAPKPKSPARPRVRMVEDAS